MQILNNVYTYAKPLFAPTPFKVGLCYSAAASFALAYFTIYAHNLAYVDGLGQRARDEDKFFKKPIVKACLAGSLSFTMGVVMTAWFSALASKPIPVLCQPGFVCILRTHA